MQAYASNARIRMAASCTALWLRDESHSDTFSVGRWNNTCTYLLASRHYVLREDVGEYKIPIAIASMYHIDDILLLTRINHESLQHTHAHIQCFLSSSL